MGCTPPRVAATPPGSRSAATNSRGKKRPMLSPPSTSERGLPESDPPTGVASLALARDAHVAPLPAGHDLAGADELSLADLAGQSFADFPANSPGRHQSDLAFAAAGVDRAVPFELTTPDLMIGLVREGLALALLPSRVAATESLTGVTVVPLADGPARVEHLAWSDFNPSPAALALVDIVRSQVDGGI